MPELPEIEHAAQQLAAVAVGKDLTAVRALHAAVRRSLPAHDAARLVGRRIEGVERRGKYQLVQFTDDILLIVHFRMAGDWQPGTVGDEPPFARAILEFSDGTAVSLVDSRALATLVVRARGDDGLPDLGLDAASPELDGVTLGRAFRRRRGSVKPVLLDQSVIAGLGNIYAAEALWHAELSPFARADILSAPDVDRLAGAIRRTIALALEDPGRYSRGEALARLSVYGRAADPCSRCATPIVRTVQAGRSTYYCPCCQREPNP